MAREYKAGKFIYTEDIAGPGTVLVTRKSELTGNYSSVLLPLTREEFEDGLALWAMKSGMLIQDAFPALDRDQREFLMTGATPEEWDKAFGGGEGMNEVKGYIVVLDGLIWGSAPTLPAAERDATVIWMMDDPQGEAQSHPATGRLLAMIDLYGGGLSWTLYRGVAMYPDEVPNDNEEEKRDA